MVVRGRGIEPAICGFKIFIMARGNYPYDGESLGLDLKKKKRKEKKEKKTLARFDVFFFFSHMRHMGAAGRTTYSFLLILWPLWPGLTLLKVYALTLPYAMFGHLWSLL